MSFCVIFKIRENAKQAIKLLSLLKTWRTEQTAWGKLGITFAKRKETMCRRSSELNKKLKTGKPFFFFSPKASRWKRFWTRMIKKYWRALLKNWRRKKINGWLVQSEGWLSEAILSPPWQFRFGGWKTFKILIHYDSFIDYAFQTSKIWKVFWEQKMQKWLII